MGSTQKEQAGSAVLPACRVPMTHDCVGSYFMGVSQLGKKVFATIFAVCPLVALLLGLK